ncbi:MAG: chitobiase/beta-hexosaminidase C-terminal domain-containing protein [Bacteroides sp.]|nr:chitobiase/beta-hexosaminidase C-terminal domain-containing protein [Bacteroides sp.]
MDVQACSSLLELNCSNNHIPQLNLLASEPLYTLNCSDNELEVLDLSGNPALKSVHCKNNRIKDIDISQCLDLRCFYADSNALPLYEIYAVSQFYDEYLKPKDINLWHSSAEQHINLKVKSGNLVDLHREMSFASTSTKVKVFTEVGDNPLFEDVDYKILEGLIKFEEDGRYKIQLRNVNVPTNCDFENEYSPFEGTNAPVTVYYHVAYGDVAPLDTCKEPVFSREAGEVEKGTVIYLTCPTKGAEIRYSTDGSTPNEESARYTASGITINKTTTVKAVAMKEDWANSEVVEAEYTVVEPVPDVCQTPQFSPEPGKVDKGTEVELYCGTEGAEIRYTTDGSTPTEESERYMEPIVINKTTTIKAIAMMEDYENSEIATGKFTVKSSTGGDDDDDPDDDDPDVSNAAQNCMLAFRAYPNPCGETLYLKRGNEENAANIIGFRRRRPLVQALFPRNAANIIGFRLLDLQGSERLRVRGDASQIDMSQLPAGVYVLEATDGNGNAFRHKIVKR